jgi:hypothetical protein
MTAPAVNPAVAAALDAALKGWRVLPCSPSTKAPLLAHGHLEATTDAETICAWWRRWPAAMLGAVVPDPYVVLDIDPRNRGSMEALEEAAGPLPQTLICWSGRGDGGRHFYFLRPPGSLTSSRLPKGIDLKVNGYCIIPPSLHPATGEPYRWELHDVARMTPRLRELLRPTLALKYKAFGGSRGGAPLVRLVASVNEGERNSALFWAACRAAEQGILSTIEADLMAAAVSRGLPEPEARRVIASALRTVRR